MNAVVCAKPQFSVFLVKLLLFVYLYFCGAIICLKYAYINDAEMMYDVVADVCDVVAYGLYTSSNRFQTKTHFLINMLNKNTHWKFCVALVCLCKYYAHK